MADNYKSPALQQIGIARRMKRMAAEHIAALSQKLRLMGWPSEHRRIALEMIAREAAAEAVRARLGL